MLRLFAMTASQLVRGNFLNADKEVYSQNTGHGSRRNSPLRCVESRGRQEETLQGTVELIVGCNYRTVGYRTDGGCRDCACDRFCTRRRIVIAENIPEGVDFDTEFNGS